SQDPRSFVALRVVRCGDMLARCSTPSKYYTNALDFNNCIISVLTHCHRWRDWTLGQPLPDRDEGVLLESRFERAVFLPRSWQKHQTWTFAHAVNALARELGVNSNDRIRLRLFRVVAEYS